MTAPTLTTAEAADASGLTVRVVTYLISAGRIEAVKDPADGKAWLIPAAELETLHQHRADRDRAAIRQITSSDALAWQDLGSCASIGPSDPEFFPGKGETTQAAKRICMGCEVRVTCLEYALANQDFHGVWGGTSERERRKILRQREAGQVREVAA
jgi:WhiB family transcriptional regulator, redox-sensing transcriptional regulator